ncbi:MAG TPA: S8 family serine peptidase [Sphingomicrobium sp.]|nr:S8 family serine peptidase [Sphingomicrobium sp.]
MSKPRMLVALLLIAVAPSAAPGQLLGGPIGGLAQPITGTVGQVGTSVGQTVDGVANTLLTPQDQAQIVAPSLDRITTSLAFAQSTADQLVQLRKLRLDALIRASRGALDRDDEGRPVRKGELIVANPDPVALSAAVRAGFRILVDEAASDLGLRMVTISVPQGVRMRQALKALRKAAPGLEADYNHVYEPAGGSLVSAPAATLASAPPARSGTRIAMIDGGVASHASLARASIEQRGFAGAPQPTGHGTAIASLLVGEQGSFRGAARGAQLFVGDVYGGNPASGSATTIVKALAWAASKNPAVINISLVGPSNRMMARAVSALRARGVAIVAAVGNDGPAAPAQYPASYPGVIAVTGVDAGDRALREAGRAAHLDFAAPGADLVAALPGNGFASVRGTSFAAPFVAARLAATESPAALEMEAVPGKGKVGRGIVCRSCRVAPKMVGLR